MIIGLKLLTLKPLKGEVSIFMFVELRMLKIPKIICETILGAILICKSLAVPLSNSMSIIVLL